MQACDWTKIKTSRAMSRILIDFILLSFFRFDQHEGTLDVVTASAKIAAPRGTLGTKMNGKLLKALIAVASIALKCYNNFIVSYFYTFNAWLAKAFVGLERHVLAGDEVFDGTVVVGSPFHAAVKAVFAFGMLLVTEDVIGDFHGEKDCFKGQI